MGKEGINVMVIDDCRRCGRQSVDIASFLSICLKMAQKQKVRDIYCIGNDAYKNVGILCKTPLVGLRLTPLSHSSQAQNLQMIHHWCGLEERGLNKIILCTEKTLAGKLFKDADEIGLLKLAKEVIVYSHEFEELKNGKERSKVKFWKDFYKIFTRGLARGK